MTRVDVHATGVLSDLQVIGRALDPSWPRRYRDRASLPTPSTGWRRKALRWGVQRLRRSVTRRNAWHGYHAEPYTLPEGLDRIGTGWTRARALRDLDRRVGAAWRTRQDPPPRPRLVAGGQIIVNQGPPLTSRDIEDARGGGMVLGFHEGYERGRRER